MLKYKYEIQIANFDTAHVSFIFLMMYQAVYWIMSTPPPSAIKLMIAVF